MINTIDDFLKFQNISLPWVYGCRVGPYQAKSPNIKSLERCCIYIPPIVQISNPLSFNIAMEALSPNLLLARYPKIHNADRNVLKF